jgi:hypothetical protein
VVSRKKLTPPQLAGQWGVSHPKILSLIESGQLAAINVAIRPNGRPRYLIDEEAIADFERRRAAHGGKA